MSNSELFLPTLDPNKFIGTPVSSVDEPIYLAWMIPSTFITVNPELRLVWINQQETSSEINWNVEYQYLNDQSYLGYFREDGSIVLNFDNGLSDVNSVTLKTENVIGRNTIQVTVPHKFIKRDRKPGTFVNMKLTVIPNLEGIYFLGAKISFTEDKLPRDPVGRKRTRKPRWYDYE